MTEARRRSLLATSVFVGSILGAGVFGLPYAFASAGWGMGFVMLLGVGGLLLVLQMMNATIVMETPGHKRLSGLAGMYLGPLGRYVTAFLLFGVVWGGMIAYTILGAGFLQETFGRGGEASFVQYGLGFLAVQAVLVWLPIKRAAHVELVIGGVLLILFLVLSLSGLPLLELSNLVTFFPARVLDPYGVVLFAMSGVAVMPELRAVFGEKYEYRLPKAVLHGIFVLFGLYALFTFMVVGVTGGMTTENALDAYTQALGPGMQFFGTLVGLLTVSSIFFMAAEQLKDTLRYDFRLGKGSAWVVTLAVPTTLFLLGVRDFISVISFIGSVFVALLACILLLIYHRLRPRLSKTRGRFLFPKWVSWMIGGVFLLGALRTIMLTLFV